MKRVEELFFAKLFQFIEIEGAAPLSFLFFGHSLLCLGSLFHCSNLLLAKL